LLRVGRNLKLRGRRGFSFGKGVSIGDACWIEAILIYKGTAYSPKLTIGNHVSISDWTHISCAKSVSIGDGCLIGSKVYIGDHSHGTTHDARADRKRFPANKPLSDLGEIVIGEGTWICDGAVILAGARIAPYSVVGANSVVKLREDRTAIIGGIPARVLRYLQ
jgi:acetyltransferase-like isoleucine patch superfamily enzyme